MRSTASLPRDRARVAFPGQMYRLALPIIPLVLVNALWTWRELVASQMGPFLKRARALGRGAAARAVPAAAVVF